MMELNLYFNYFAILIVLILLLYYYLTRNFNYWIDKGVAGPKPLPFFGNFANVIFGIDGPTTFINNLYSKWKYKPYFGIYKSKIPILIINDLNLIKNILIKDFTIFSGRGMNINESIDPLSAHLFNIDGPRWKYLRIKLSPIFTSGKLKYMFNLMEDCAEHFDRYLIEQIKLNNVIEVREAAAKFTTDVIGTTAFGIEMNALAVEDSEFRKMGKKIFESNLTTVIRRFVRESFPIVYKIFKFRSFSKEITDFFINSLNETIQFREENNIIRKDLVDTLMEIKRSDADFELTEGLIAAQAFVFFIAGFETSSTTIAFALYELALETEVQEKLRREILETLGKNNGELSYEIVKEMKYLDMVIQETLRKNPPVSVLQRQAFQSYKIPESDIIIDSGTKVFIPIYGIQHDERYFKNPEQFDPERFSDERKSSLHPMAHLPFGDGPKNCIGMRFGLYQVKLGLIKILKKFRVKPSNLTEVPYKIDKTSLILSAQGGINLHFEFL